MPSFFSIAWLTLLPLTFIEHFAPHTGAGQTPLDADHDGNRGYVDEATRWRLRQHLPYSLTSVEKDAVRIYRRRVHRHTISRGVRGYIAAILDDGRVQ